MFNKIIITIVGGAALNVYDYTLKALEERHTLEALENYIKKKTSDIDIVWWSHESRNIKIKLIINNFILQKYFFYITIQSAFGTKLFHRK